jgi:hypothetical protein
MSSPSAPLSPWVKHLIDAGAGIPTTVTGAAQQAASAPPPSTNNSGWGDWFGPGGVVDQYAQNTVNDPNASYADSSQAKTWLQGPNHINQPMGIDPRLDSINPGIAEQQIPGYVSQLTQPTNAQAFYDQGSFNTPTAAENFNNQYGPQMAQPGASSDWFSSNQGSYSTPGAAENWFAQNGQQFNTPGAAEDYWASVKGQAGTPPEVTNRAEEAYQHIKGNMPTIASDPGLTPYYNDAVNRTTRELNSQLAARGAYGSSVGVGKVGDAVRGLLAEKANREAQYNLARLAEQRNWESTMGQEAASADTSSGRQAQSKLGWILGFGDLANNAGQARLSRLLGGSGASQGAQSAQTARLNSGATAANMADTNALSHLQAAGTAAANATNGEMQRQGLGMQAANVADSSNRAGLLGAIDATIAAQTARQGRIQDQRNYLTSTAGNFSKLTGDLLTGVTTTDQALQQAAMQYGTAAVAEAERYADQVSQRGTQAWMQIVQLTAAGIAGGGGGAGGAAAGAAAVRPAAAPPPAAPVSSGTPTADGR